MDMSRQFKRLMASAMALAALAPIAHAERIRFCYTPPAGGTACKTYTNMTCADVIASWSANSGTLTSCRIAPLPAAMVLPDPISIGGTGGIEVQLGGNQLLIAVRIEEGVTAAAPLPQPAILNPASPVYYAVLEPGQTLDAIPLNGFETFSPPIVGEASFTLCAVNFDLVTHAVLSISTVPIDVQALTFTPVTVACPADIGVQGGLPGRDGRLDNNDFVVFINAFFSGDATADCGQQGGMSGSDGQFDNNDFIVFIDQFFTAC
jgi:hypothetical protein